MRKRTLNPLVVALAVLVALLTFYPAPRVAADEPTIVFIPVDETSVIPGAFNPCGFDIVVQVQGRVKVTGDSHNPNQLLGARGMHTHVTFTNPENGKSVTSVTNTLETGTPSDDGDSAIYTISGLYGRFTVPGEGLVAGSIGRLVLEYDCPIFSCVPEVTFQAGTMEGSQFETGAFPALCDLLSD